MAVATGTPARDAQAGGVTRHAGHRPGGGVVFHLVMAPVALLWVAPMLFAAAIAVRSFDDVTERGLGALPASFTLSGFVTAVTEVELGTALVNSLIVTAPAVVLALLLSSMAAFGLSRYEIPFRRTILLGMLAGNLLPPQVLLIPVAKMSENIGTYDALVGLVAIHVGFGLGFYTFVLYGFMRSIPREVTEAAVVDGAGSMQVYWRIVMPLSRPALAALAALATTWIYNDLVWALTILQSQAKFPITAALLNLQGSYVSQWNVVASGAMLAAIPTAVVFFAFQRHFVSGLLVGSTK
ncbi:MAG: ABC transporter permease subunit [Streptosporangiales bacterium]|nr:ABC transporter permease subunit [Streptosporangiales bacterium]